MKHEMRANETPPRLSTVTIIGSLANVLGAWSVSAASALPKRSFSLSENFAVNPFFAPFGARSYPLPASNGYGAIYLGVGVGIGIGIESMGLRSGHAVGCVLHYH